MPWQDDALNVLTATPTWGYHVDGPAATEPAALATLALLAYDRPTEAQRGIDWLLARQSPEGSLGITADQQTPNWPTSLAVLAFLHAAQRGMLNEKTKPAAQRGGDWILTEKGVGSERNADVGHDTTLVAWAWVAGTHSWIEPTAMHVLALKQLGKSNNARTREAIRLLGDRLLPTGGCNYGNTSVLGQILRPQMEPTGLCLAALSGESGFAMLVERSLNWLEDQLESATTISLAYGLMGLSAYGRTPESAPQLLQAATERALRREKSPYKAALLALAGLDRGNPLLAHLGADKAVLNSAAPVGGGK